MTVCVLSGADYPSSPCAEFRTVGVARCDDGASDAYYIFRLPFFDRCSIAYCTDSRPEA